MADHTPDAANPSGLARDDNSLTDVTGSAGGNSSAGAAAGDSKSVDSEHGDPRTSKAIHVYLIRHGTTVSMDGGEVAQDDPLATVGVNAADQLYHTFGEHWPAGAKVLVSPLRRALETGLRTFGHLSPDPLKPLRGTATLHVEPELREFSFYQRAEEPLYRRHAGHTKKELIDLYPVAAPDKHAVVWPETLAPDAHWWEPHGDFAGDYVNVGSKPGEALFVPKTALDRVCAFMDRLFDETPDGSVVGIVAHENVFRLMTGLWSVETTSPLQCVMMRSEISMHTHRSPATRPVVTCMPVSLAAHFTAGRSARPSTAIVVLGCSAREIMRVRIVAGVRLAQRTGGLLIFAVAASEYVPLRETLNQLLHQDPSVKEVLFTSLTDIHSRWTECNINYAASLLHKMHRVMWRVTDTASFGLHKLHGAWTVHLVTNDWHMPRALLAFRNQIHLNHWNWIHLITHSVPTAITDIVLYERTHLLDGVILASRVNLYPALWKQVRVDCAKDLHVVAILLRIWASSRIGLVTKGHRVHLRSLLRTAEHYDYEQVKLALTSAYREHDVPLAMVPLVDTTEATGDMEAEAGNTALHYAVMLDALELVHDLLYFWGADPNAYNVAQETPMSIARRRGKAEIIAHLRSMSSLQSAQNLASP